MALLCVNCNRYPQNVQKRSKWPKKFHGMCCSKCVQGIHGMWCTSLNPSFAYEADNTSASAIGVQSLGNATPLRQNASNHAVFGSSSTASPQVGTETSGQLSSTSEMLFAPRHVSRGSLQGAVRIDGRAKTRRSAAINGIYTPIEGGFLGSPAFERLASERVEVVSAKTARFLFYIGAKRRWNISDYLGNKRSFAYAFSDYSDCPVAHDLRWHVWDGKGEGFNVDAAVRCTWLADQGHTAAVVSEEKPSPSTEIGSVKASSSSSASGVANATAADAQPVKRRRLSGKQSPTKTSGGTSVATQVGSSSRSAETGSDVTPGFINLRKCFATTRSNECEGQCPEDRLRGSYFCSTHQKDASTSGGLGHGLVGGAISQRDELPRAAESKNNETRDALQTAVTKIRRRLHSQKFSASRIDERAEKLIMREQRRRQNQRAQHDPQCEMFNGSGRQRPIPSADERLGNTFDAALTSSGLGQSRPSTASDEKLANAFDAAFESFEASIRPKSGDLAKTTDTSSRVTHTGPPGLSDLLDCKGAVKSGNIAGAVRFMNSISSGDNEGKLAVLRSIRLAMVRESLEARAFIAVDGVSAVKHWLESALSVVTKDACPLSRTKEERIILEGLEILKLLPMTFPVLAQTKIGRVVTRLGNEFATATLVTKELNAGWKREFSREIEGLQFAKELEGLRSCGKKKTSSSSSSSSYSSSSSCSPMEEAPIDTEVLETTMKLPTTAPKIQPSVASSSSEAGDVGRDMVGAESPSSSGVIHEIADSPTSSGLENTNKSKVNEAPQDGIHQRRVASQELDVPSPDVSALSEIGDIEVSATIQELLRLGEVLQQRSSVDSSLASPVIIL